MISTIADAQEDVQDMVDNYAAATTAIAPLLETNTQTDQDLEHLRANLSAVVLDFRAFRRDLDTLDSLDLLQTQQNAARILQTWTWERETRAAVQDFMGGVVETAGIAEGILVGSDRGTYTTRAGETLQSIAQNELGDFAAWTRILGANPGLLPGVLPAGTTLVIPEKR